MLQSTMRTLIAALLVGGAIAAPPAASARIFLDRQSPAVSTQEIGTTLPQIGGVQTRSNGFDWADAGIGAGAAVALTLTGLGARLTVTRRRQPRAAAPSVTVSAN